LIAKSELKKVVYKINDFNLSTLDFDPPKEDLILQTHQI
jgi:hypothetical protein